MSREVSNYKTLKEFRTKSESAYKACLSQGLKDELLSKLESRIYWTHDSVISEGRKYTGRHSFQKGSNSAYNYALTNNLLDTIFPETIKDKVSWCYQTVTEEANKYKNRSSFKYGSGGAFKFAYEKGMLSKLFGDTADVPLCDNDVVYIWKVLDLPVYKIGKSSSRLTRRRLDYVARKSGLTIEESYIYHVKNAKEVEKLLLKVGLSYLFDNTFNGSTEFRQLTDQEVSDCLSILETYKMKPEESPKGSSKDGTE